MANNTIHILWDSSHLWGIMAWRTLHLMGASPRLTLARKIAQGALMRKHGSVLLAPGGSARQKASHLGAIGLGAIRDWVKQGGAYLGFCGGAGLALTHENSQEGLNICPWRRKSYADRLYHLVSGPLLGEIDGTYLELPVWWPGRFAVNQSMQLEILARYVAPGKGLWLADLPFMEAPEQILDQWRQEGSLDSAMSITPGQPLIISGKFGAGQYVLSYVHLETPAAHDANSYLATLLRKLGNINIGNATAPDWTLAPCEVNSLWGKELALAMAHIDELLALGKKLGFFFDRMPWLLGWRRGAPGMACNNLLACAVTLAQMQPTEAALAYWQAIAKEFGLLMENFAKLGKEWLWHWQLAHTLNITGAKRKNLESQRNKIFGHPMLGGGVLAQLLEMLENGIYLCQAAED